MFKRNTFTILLYLFFACILLNGISILIIEKQQENFNNKSFIQYLLKHKDKAEQFTFTTKNLLIPGKELYSPFPRSYAFSRLPIQLIRASFHYQKTCLDKDFVKADAIARKFFMSPSKLLIWNQSVCKNNKKLFLDWFKRRPYLHPSGFSYAQLYLKKWNTSPDINNYNDYFHVTEAKKLTSFDRWFLSLSKDDQTQYIKGPKVQLIKNWIIVANEWNGSFQNVYIFSLHYVNHILKEKYSLKINSLDQANYCDFIHFEICFKNEEHISWKKSWNKIILSYFIFFIFLSFFILYFLKRKAEQNSTEEQALLFQLISHELRTPMTSINLGLGNLKNQFDSMSTSGQKSFLHILDSFKDLEKIVLKTLKELKKENSSVKFDAIITSQTIIENNYQDLITFELSEKQQGPLFIEMPLFWFEICLLNLLRNALNHGEAPVFLRIKKSGEYLIVEIEDQGKVEIKKLKASLKPFKKSQTSQGLGLGLSIINRKIKEFSGELIILNKPTRFILKFPIAKGKE